MPSQETVISVRAGKSYPIIVAHLIYSCPVEYDYEATKLITFRSAPPESRMEKVFAIERIDVINPLMDETSWNLPDDLKSRVKDYFAAAKPKGIISKQGGYRIYFLAPNPITLAHRPKSVQDTDGAAYFALAELQSWKALASPIQSLSYREKLMDERWLQKRQRLLDSRGQRCELCGCIGNLTIHHGYYRFKTDPWDYDNASLWVLCWPCHEKTQMLTTTMHVAIGHTHPRELPQLKSKITDAAFEVQFGISSEEAEAILNEERSIEQTLYSDYTAEVFSNSDLGPTIAYEILQRAVERFPGLQVSVTESPSDPDGISSVSGPNPNVANDIGGFLEREREKRG